MLSVVLLSGGIDSAVCLAMALQHGNVTALHFNYGATHSRQEEFAASLLAEHYGVAIKFVDLSAVVYHGDSWLMGGATERDPVQPYYVPARNTVFLAMAASLAEHVGAERIWIGAHGDDEDAQFPDCRAQYLQRIREAVMLGTNGRVFIEAPFAGKTKRHVVVAGRRLAVPFEKTYSCYAGFSKPCDKCPACVSRAAALRV